ncbi:MAG: PAS domain-containing protein [Fibrobacteres bacterium]|nr:PAS domain-containing protein [Fibrobacterota bacterium]
MDNSKNRFRTVLLLIIIVGLIIGLGSYFYKAQKRNIQSAVERQLLSIADLKVFQIEQWREELKVDVGAVRSGPFFLSSTEAFLRGNISEKEKLLKRLRVVQEIYGYHDVLLADLKGDIQLRINPGPAKLATEMMIAVQRAIQENDIILTTLHLGKSDGIPHLDVVAPLVKDNSHDVFGVLTIRINVPQTLYPIILKWPVPSTTGEALLVRQDGDSVLFLNEVRHKTGTALHFKIPMTNIDVPAVRAVLGHEGVFVGKDYRGINVVSAIRSINDCDWRIVVKEDVKEAFAEWYSISKAILGLIFGMILTAVAIVGMLRQRELKEHYQTLYKSESALAREREQLAVTLRSIGDGVITTDAEGRVTLLNKVAEHLTGWSTQDAMGKKLPEVFNIVHEYTRAQCENPVEKVLRTGEIIELANHTMLLSKDNKSYIIADSGAPIRNDKSEIVGVVLVFRDMTEKQRMQDNMQRSQKLDALGVLAGGIAHDFNNLLSGIFGNVDMARDYFKRGIPDKGFNALDRAIGVFNRAKNLTQQFLTFAKGGDPVRRVSDVSSLLRETVLFALSGSPVNCKFNIAEKLPHSEIDVHQIGQVVDNIVINAKQAMPMGGTLEVSAETVWIGLGEHPTLSAGSYVKIQFADTGVGMPPDIVPRIFDPFFTTKQMGSGLGLATAYSIIRHHDGFIEASSVQGEGSVFSIYLPASEKKMSKSDSVTTRSETKGTGAILLMDDEVYMREFACETLEGAGYECINAADGREAIALYEKAIASGKTIAAAILDLTVPGGMGGLETSKELHRLNGSLPIIVSSGYSTDPVMAEPEKYHFCASLTKPYRKQELLEVVRQHTV